MTAKDMLRHLSTSLEQMLSRIGFKKKRMSSFRRDIGDVIQFIDLQKSKDSSETRLLFTVNVGIYSRVIGDESDVEVDVWDCHWTTRLGHLMPESRDLWWECSSVEEATMCAESIGGYLSTYAVPQLNELCSTQRLINLWESGQSPGLTDFQRMRYLEAARKRLG